MWSEHATVYVIFGERTFTVVNTTAARVLRVGVAIHRTLMIKMATMAVILMAHCGRASGEMSEFVLW